MPAPLTSQGYPIEDDDMCDLCEGTGKIWTDISPKFSRAERCPECDGTGLRQEEK